MTINSSCCARPAYNKESPLNGVIYIFNPVGDIHYNKQVLNEGEARLKHKFVFDAEVVVEAVLVGANNGGIGVGDFLPHIVL